MVDATNMIENIIRRCFMKKWLLIFLIFPMSVMAENAMFPKEMAQAFFITVIKGDVSKAYDQLFIGSSIPTSKPQAVTLLKQQTESGLPLYGKILDFEMIRKVKYGKSITRLVYVLKSEMAPTVWEFYFYKPNNAWVLTNVVFNDQYDLLK